MTAFAKIPFEYSTKGVSPLLKDLPEEESVYRSLSEASQGVFSVDQVRVIRRVFDRADEDGNFFVDIAELRLALRNLHENVATRVLEEILASSGHEDKWSFPAFVHMMRLKLSSDERVQLIAMEEEYIRSMGIDDAEQKSLEEFRNFREERRKSQMLKPQTLTDRPHPPPRRQSHPNDVDEYRREFGLE